MRKEVFMGAIQWETDLQVAISRAAKESKPILLDFFNPG
jgi:hypothetical protein